MLSDLFQIPFFDIIRSPSKAREAARYSSKRPTNTPRKFMSHAKAPGIVVACLGDSLTHGHVSSDWVRELRIKLPPPDFHIINAGINGNVAWQLNQRLDEIIMCEPDIVIILIGTNDAMGSFHDADGLRYKKSEGLPHVPSQDIYTKELHSILQKLSHIRKLGVCTLPPIGENPDSAINRLVLSFNEDIERITKRENRVILPVHQELMSIIKSRSQPPQRDYVPGPLNRFLPIVKAIADHRLGDLTWDETGALQDLVLLTDHIHLGDRGGAILGQLVEDFIR